MKYVLPMILILAGTLQASDSLSVNAQRWLQTAVALEAQKDALEAIKTDWETHGDTATIAIKIGIFESKVIKFSTTDEFRDAIADTITSLKDQMKAAKDSSKNYIGNGKK